MCKTLKCFSFVQYKENTGSEVKQFAPALILLQQLMN